MNKLDKNGQNWTTLDNIGRKHQQNTYEIVFIIDRAP